MAKTSPGPESLLVDLVLRSIGILYGSKADVWKNHGSEYGPVGLPDLIGHINGLFIGWELKANGSYPTRLQAHKLVKLFQTGSIAGMIVDAPANNQGPRGIYYVPAYILAAHSPKNPMLSYDDRTGWKLLPVERYPTPGGEPVNYLKLSVFMAEYLE